MAKKEMTARALGSIHRSRRKTWVDDVFMERIKPFRGVGCGPAGGVRK
jgi:hypothetical protein